MTGFNSSLLVLHSSLNYHLPHRHGFFILVDDFIKIHPLRQVISVYGYFILVDDGDGFYLFT